MLVLLAAVALTAGLWFVYVYRLDRVEPEPLRVLIWVGLAGGIMSSLPAALCNDLYRSLNSLAGLDTLPFDQALRLGLFVGFNEEFFKLSATFALVRKSRHFNEPADGVVYATMVALGFAAFENMVYASANGLGVLVTRSVTAIPMHIGLASLWGYGLSRWKFLGTGLAGLARWYVLAALIHAAYDAALFVLPPERGLASLALALIVSWIMFKVMTRLLNGLVAQSPFVRGGYCPACDSNNGASDDFCKHCGARLIQDFYRPCKGCGIKLDLDMVFCPRCGTRVDG